VTRVLILAGLAAVLAVAVSLAQARGDRAGARKPLPGLPAYTAGYAGWTKINRAPIRGGSPAHPGTKNVYANKRKIGKRFPLGTVIVKEIRNGPALTIAVMRKVRTGPSRYNRWVMTEWARSRPGARFGVLARGQICYACHIGAKANDYVFTRG
jgi:Cytochrome P460